jgi:mannose-6-phosphate isomerase-like protein (cupin superfamily)
MGAAIGYLAPGTRYGVHFHYALEQLSFVIRGQIAVTMRGPDDPAPVTRLVRPGEAITNPPGVTLDFANDGPEPAEVLFVCAPPFPPRGEEVGLADDHRPLTDAERAHRQERAAWALAHFRRAIGA